MLTTDKDFDGISDNNHPTTYYWDKGDTKPTNNVMNGAAGIEMDVDNNKITIYFFSKSHNQWVVG